MPRSRWLLYAPPTLFTEQTRFLPNYFLEVLGSLAVPVDSHFFFFCGWLLTV